MIQLILMFALLVMTHPAIAGTITVDSNNGAEKGTCTSIASCIARVDTANQTWHVRGSLTAIQTNYSSASIHGIPSNVKLVVEKGGSLYSGPGATQFRIYGVNSIEPEMWGGGGDNATDSTLAIAAAERSAYVSGARLEFKKGGVYLQNGSRVFRCPIYGYGATLKNIVGTIQTTSSSAVVSFIGINNLTVYGLTVDGGSYSTGFTTSANTGIRYVDCKALHCRSAGYSAYNATVSYLNCAAYDIKYATASTTYGSLVGGAADGFYGGGCVDNSYVGCSAENFQRIGFVSDLGGSMSQRPRFTSCIATNANNCDISTTEFNAGFWIENTTGATLDQITAVRIATGVGQTSGRVRGVVLNPSGGNAITSMSNFTVGDSGGTLAVGIAAYGYTDGLPKVVVSVGSIQNYNTGISVLSGLDSLSVDDVSFKDGMYSSGGTGGIVVDLSGGNGLNTLNISKISELNPTYTNADAGTFNWYSNGGASTIVNIDQCAGISAVSRGGGYQLNVDNSKIYYHSANFGLFDFSQNTVNNSQLTAFPGNNGKLFLSGGSPVGATAQFSNCGISGFNAIEAGGGGDSLQIANSRLSDTSINWFPNGPNSFILTGVNWVNAVLNAPCITSNYYAGSVNTPLIVNGCNLVTINSYALKKHSNGGPTPLIAIGNIYHTGSSFTDMTVTYGTNTSY